jgi:hypothetical protein
MDISPWITDETAPLLTDLYELTMLQAYWKESMDREGVFSLFTRRLPKRRNYLLACGLADVLRYLETLLFPPQGVDYLSTLPFFTPEFLEWLEGFRFGGDVYAMPEGTPFFADEPVLEVVAPVAQGQLVETFLMNQVHFQTVLASKASRVVTAARGRTVVDFGLRRMPGTDAGVKGARAFHIAGVDATSNVFAGSVYGLKVSGTMAHSYIQAHEEEMDAFRAFAALYPGRSCSWTPTIPSKACARSYVWRRRWAMPSPSAESGWTPATSRNSPSGPAGSWTTPDCTRSRSSPAEAWTSTRSTGSCAAEPRSPDSAWARGWARPRTTPPWTSPTS